jgi:hypothetical protein
LDNPKSVDIYRGRVRDAFSESRVWVLGNLEPADSREDSLQQSKILHFVADDETGTSHVMLPVFTSRDALRLALLRNDGWRESSVIELAGGELAPNIAPDVTIIVDPWTPGEYRLPPDPTGAPTIRPSR